MALKWVFGADTGPFRRGLNDMRSQTKSFAGSMKGMLAGALGFAAITAAFRSMFVEMDRVQKLGIRFNETAETIQKVKLAAELAGSDIEGLAKAITVATRNAHEAATGNIEYAETFETLGIDAAAFINLPMEEKILLLAKSLESGAGSGEKLALMMDVLGKGGAEMIPLLSQGPEALQELFENTSTASQSTVDSIAAFNDSLTKLKQKAQVVGSSVINGFRLIFGVISAGAGMLFMNLMTGFDHMVKGAKIAASSVAMALSGNLVGAAKEALKLGGVLKDAFNDGKKNAIEAGQIFSETFNEIFDPKSKGSTPAAAFEDAKAKAEELAKIEKERKKLSEDIAKLEEDARIRQLSLAEKILDAEKRRADLATQAAEGGNTPEGLKARKEELAVEKELEALRKQQGAEVTKTTKATEKKAKEIAGLAEREAGVDRTNLMAKMGDKEKMAFLEKERDGFSATAGSATDPKAAAEARISAKERQGEIDGIRQSLADKLQGEADGIDTGPVIATSSLAEVGGGGNAAIFGSETREQRKVELLAEIASLLRDGEGGESTTIEPTG